MNFYECHNDIYRYLLRLGTKKTLSFPRHMKMIDVAADWQIHVSSALKVLFTSKFYLFSIQMLLARRCVSLRSLFYEPRPVKFVIVPSIVGYAFLAWFKWISISLKSLTDTSRWVKKFATLSRHGDSTRK